MKRPALTMSAAAVICLLSAIAPAQSKVYRVAFRTLEAANDASPKLPAVFKTWAMLRV